MVRKFTYFFVALLMMWGVVLLYNKTTDGFSIREMASTLQFDPAREVRPPSIAVQKQLENIFGQEYHYLGKGCQFYAFESCDGKYVIKFFKQKHLRELDWLNELPIPNYFQGWCDDKIERRKKRIEKLFRSCKLAYEEMSFETGILCVHLNKTPVFERTLILRDKLGIRHQINLDAFEFVVQKRAEQVKEAFDTLDQTQNESEAYDKINQLVQVVIDRCQKGIVNTDRSFAQNVAFCLEENRAVYVDIGQFIKDESILSAEATEKEVRRRLRGLLYWMKRHHPCFTYLVEKKLNEY